MRRFTRARLAGELLAGPASTASASSHRVRQTLLALHVATGTRGSVDTSPQMVGFADGESVDTSDVMAGFAVRSPGRPRPRTGMPAAWRYPRAVTRSTPVAFAIRRTVQARAAQSNNLLLQLVIEDIAHPSEGP